MNSKNFIILFSFLFSIFLNSETIHLKTGKKLENVKIEKEDETRYIITTEDGLLASLDKEKIHAVQKEGEKEPPPLPPPPKPKPEFIFSQIVGNDYFAFGSSLFGERYDRRNSESYNNLPKSLVLANVLNIFTPIEGLKLSLITASSVTSRSNKDVDGWFQTTPGGQNQNQLVVNEINSGRLTNDPNALKRQKERNGVKDYVLFNLSYDWNTKAGGFTTGIFMINSLMYPNNAVVGNYFVGYKFPFLTMFNPTVTSYFRFTSESAGINQGNSHHRFSISYEFFKGQSFRIVPEIQSGYQYMNNNIDRKIGVTDISTSVRFIYKLFAFTVTDVYRPNLYMFDNVRSYPNSSSGYAVDTNSNDGRTVDPSRVYGTYNNFVRDYIQSNVPAPYQNLVLENYQSQKIPQHIFTFSLGYTLRF